MDIILLETIQKKVASFLSITYAFISEVDLGSESLKLKEGAWFEYGELYFKRNIKQNIIINKWYLDIF